MTLNTHNLPIQPTPFIGREQELAAIRDRLNDPACRLLTLVGAGGIGKSRLAIQAADDHTPHVADGIYFVPLTPVDSSDRIASAIAGALQLSLYGSEDPVTQLTYYLRQKHMLLVLDNFDHLLAGTELLTTLLQSAAHIKILVTSRERLNMQEEWALTVDGLSFPRDSTHADLETFSAVQLFVQRAQQVQAGFLLDEHLQAVQQICQQVEGMPLGLELAATWLRAMPCKQIATQIAASLDFLTTPLRNMPERHRSLRIVFEQSWNLLSPAEQNGLMRLSVFRGGFDGEAAEQVAGASLPLLAGLVDKSLIRLNAAERYDLHELLRQYAADKLADAGEADTALQRHLDYFLKLAEQVEIHNFGREQIIWYNRVETELDNIRAALVWSLETETSLRLAAALGWFFSERCYWVEGDDWLERTLTANTGAPPSLRAKALHHAGALTGHLNDHQRAQALCEEALTLARAQDDRWNIAWSLSQLGIHGEQHPEKTGILLEESLRLFREINEPMSLCHALIRRVINANGQGDYVYTRALLEEAAIIAEEADDKISRAWIALLSAEVSWFQDDDLRQAKAYFETSLELFRESRFPWAIADVLGRLAQIEAIMEHDASAEMLYQQALNLQQERLLHNESVDVMFVGLAGIARAHGELERAGILLGAAEDMVVDILSATAYPISDNFQRTSAEVKAQLGEKAFADAFAKGKAMTRTEAIAYALEGKPQAVHSQPSHNSLAELLTKREIEILSLMTEGLSNRAIAEQLFLSPGTVKWYLSKIYSNLGVNGRVQAIARARELSLLT